MTIDEAASLLRDMYSSGKNKEQAVQVHLFGIKYAEALDGKPLKQIAERAGIPASYGTEIRKGINLAKYVVLKS